MVFVATSPPTGSLSQACGQRATMQQPQYKFRGLASLPAAERCARLRRSSVVLYDTVNGLSRGGAIVPCAVARGRSTTTARDNGAASGWNRIQELYGEREEERARILGLYGRDSFAADDNGKGEAEDFDRDDDEEDDEEDEDEEEEEEAAILARSVVQVRTLHRVPNFLRPWEEGHEAESTSSGFVVELEAEEGPQEGQEATMEAGEQQQRQQQQPGTGVGSETGPRAVRRAGGRPPQRQLLIMTTAGAVEHARKVEVSRSADDATPFPATVAAVCLDLDVALLRVEQPAFWGLRAEGAGGRRRGLRGRGGRGSSRKGDSGEGGGEGPSLVPLQLDPDLPYLRQPVFVAGFPLGGGSLCVTSGVVSRIEVVEYSHSGRGLLALQVDAPLNNGGWGGPALCPSSGRCLGMAFQKFTSQTWMERYDEAAADMFAGGGEEDEGDGDDGDGGGGEGQEGEGDGGGGGGAPGQEYDDDAENIGYLVPAPLLRLVLADYRRQLRDHHHHRHGHTGPRVATASGGAASVAPLKRGAGKVARSAAAALTPPPPLQVQVADAAAPSGPLYLEGRPRLGLRYQRLESPALRRWLGLAAGESGLLVTGVDPSGSAAGVLRVHDVLLRVAGRQISNDGTTLLRPGQRVLFGHWAALAEVGGELPLTVLRGGQRLELKARLRGAGAPFVPMSLGPGRRPQYLVVGPLVFLAFSLPFWYELMAGLQRRRPQTLADRRQLQSGLAAITAALEWGLPSFDGDEEVVVLAEVLDCGEQEGEEEEEEGEDSEAMGGETATSGGTNSTSSSSTSSGSSEESSSGRSVEESDRGDLGSSRTAADGADANPGSGGPPAGVASEAAAWEGLLGGVPRRVATVNGERVRNLAHLAAAVVRTTSAAASPSAPLTGGADGVAVPSAAFLRLGLEPAEVAVVGTASAAVVPPRDTPNEEGEEGATDLSTMQSPAAGSSSGDAAGGGGGGGDSGVGVGSGAPSGVRGHLLVLDAARLAADTRAVMRHHSMAAAMAAELRRQLGTQWPFEGEDQAKGPGRQRRLQGRRLGLGGRR